MTKVYMATKSDLEQVKAAFNANDTTNVGYITWQMCLMRNYLKLNGMPLVNASIDYADLLQFAVDHELITTDVNDKALFKYDEAEDVLTLPDYMDLCLQGGTMVQQMAAGLPNITGGGTLGNRLFDRHVSSSDTVTLGALQYTTFEQYVGKCISEVNDNNKTAFTGMNIDASRSSSIYGASTTVQPPAIKLIPQIKYRHGVDGQVNYGDGTPLGTVIMFMGTVAPANYLFCDGTTYAIADYPKFTAFIAKQFGSVNHFGGDGETTFAVPDLRGEFLRCTGTNAHTDQGSGANVGVHQDGTQHTFTLGWQNKQIILNTYNTSTTIANAVTANADKGQGRIGGLCVGATYFSSQSNADYSLFTSRPTNTSVMYCIKVKTGDEQ